MTHDSIKTRAIDFSGVTAYVIVFNFIYIDYIAPKWGYYGMTYMAPNFALYALAWIFALLPSLWLPINTGRATEFVYWCLYLTVYIPSLFVPLYVQYDTDDRLLFLLVGLFIGLNIMMVVYRLPLLSVPRRPFDRRLYWFVVALIALTLDAIILITFRHQLRLVGFGDVYEVRLNSRMMTTNNLVGYAIMILGWGIDPLLIAMSMFDRRRFFNWKFCLGAAGQLLVYSAAAHKVALLTIVLIPLFSTLLTRARQRWSSWLVWSLSGSLAFFILLLQIWPRSLLVMSFGDLLCMRTLVTPGFLTAAYEQFFSRYPHTWFLQHLPLLGRIYYPYQYDLGFEVGYYLNHNPEFNANAHFWASDGLAGAGIPGILVASVLCTLIFWVVDSMTSRFERAFASTMIFGWALQITNVSLFTSVTTGGLGMLLVLLVFSPVRDAAIHNWPRLPDRQEAE